MFVVSLRKEVWSSHDNFWLNNNNNLEVWRTALDFGGTALEVDIVIWFTTRQKPDMYSSLIPVLEKTFFITLGCYLETSTEELLCLQYLNNIPL